MSITIKKKEVPDRLPAARLRLDDIEAVVQILRCLVEKQKLRSDSSDPPATRFTFTVGDQQCDELEELRKIGKKYGRLEILVERDWFRAGVDIHPIIGASFRTSFVAADDELMAYRDLEDVFSRRKAHLRVLARAHPVWSWLLIGLVAGVIFGGPFSARTKLAYGVAYVGAIALGLWPTSIVFRRSWEPSPFLQYLRDKIVPVAVGVLLGSLLTLVGTFVKHKLWP